MAFNDFIFTSVLFGLDWTGLDWTGLAGGEGRGDEWQNIPPNKKLNRVFAAIAKIAEKLRDKSLKGTGHQGKIGVEFGGFVSVGTVARF